VGKYSGALRCLPQQAERTEGAEQSKENAGSLAAYDDGNDWRVTTMAN